MAHDSPFSSRSDSLLLWVGLALMAICLVSMSLFSGAADLDDAAKEVQATVSDKWQELEQEMDELIALPYDEMIEVLVETGNVKGEAGVYYYLRDEEQLLAWSSTSVPEIDLLGDFVESGPCVLLSNGYYLISERTAGDLTLHGLTLIKYQYAYENRYLVNDYPSYFDLLSTPEISFVSGDDARPIVDARGEVLFFLSQGESRPSSKSIALWSILLIVALYLLLFGLFDRVYRQSPSQVSLLLLVLSLLLFRYVSLLTLEMEVMRALPGFSPTVYASGSLFPSLYDYFINAFLFLMCAVLGYKWVASLKDHGLKMWQLVVGIAVYLIYGAWVNELIISLVYDSSLDFDVTVFFDIDGHGILGVVALGLLLFSVYQLARIVATFLSGSISSRRNQVMVLFGLGVAHVVVCHFIGIVDMMLVLWAWVVLCLMVFLEWYKHRRMLVSRPVLVIMALSFYSSHMLTKYVEIKDRTDLEVTADHLLDGSDPVAEYLFKEVEAELIDDQQLWALYDTSDVYVTPFLDRLKDRYFKGYWSRYDIGLTGLGSSIEGAGGESSAKGGSGREEVFGRLDRLSPKAQFVKASRSQDNVAYLARLDGGPEKGVVYLDFTLKIIPEELGFPELLLEGRSLLEGQLSRYSLAQYYDGRLIARYGDYDYKTMLDIPVGEAGSQDRYYFERNGAIHHPFSRGEETYVISGDKKSAFHHLTTFTYLLSLLALLYLFGGLIQRGLAGRAPLVVNLQNKIQVLIIGVVLISLMVFGIGAYFYIVEQHREKNINLLSEKIDSVLIELQHKLEKEGSLNDNERLAANLDKFSRVFFSDINLYALNGELMASSRPQLFSKGIVSTRMDPRAFSRLTVDRESKHIQTEHVGGLEYYSAYVPFRNSKNEILAYLSLPYFAKQSELEDELSAFVVAMVNVLVLLFAFSILVALIFSNWITRPLKRLQESLATISLDRVNRPIPYSGTDEIASLVKEYNTKVKELEENAEALARSERESAWREMAKQVAHEIKNPLTPMKLSIQYLQRSFEDGGNDWGERFKRSTNTLIEQIDTLSGIATAFSDFAKMPTPAKERFDLRESLEQAVSLFAGQPDFEIHFVTELTGQEMISADKDQITRLFNNLIKNAKQAIPTEQEGKVIVSLEAKGFQYIIEVKDNGEGIPKEMYDRIFVPNFTTKTTGTGLGLAMCKNIVESAGGEIWFRSKKGVGTTFSVSLPMLQEED